MNETEDPPTVLIVGGGIAGLTAAIFTARAGLETTVVNHGESILARNAHLENVPGFPLGVNARTFLTLTREQAAENGVGFTEGRVTRLTNGDDRFVAQLETSDWESDRRADFVVSASWADTDYLADIGVGLTKRGKKTFVDVDEYGRTGVEGLYAAGRIAEKAHQTVVAAGHGAEVALTLIDDSEVPFYHDWVAPEGYFTGRGREVPPGCEEISEAERRDRETESLERLREAFSTPQEKAPTQHPSVAEESD